MSSSDGPVVLVTGGCGYIGTHTITILLQKGYSVVVVDNLINSSAIALDRVSEIVGLSEDDRKKRLIFHNVDICDEAAFRKVFESSPKFISAIHFAGLKVRDRMCGCIFANECRSVSCARHIERYECKGTLTTCPFYALGRLSEKVLAFPSSTMITT